MASEGKQAKTHHTLAERYLALVCHNLAVVKQKLHRYGNLSLAEYLQEFRAELGAPFQQRDDLCDAVYRYVAPLLGESAARRAVRDLATYPVVLTANHHGVECFAQTFQARLIFAAHVISGATSTSTVPVFAFGNVALNNPTFPRGLLLYHVEPDKLDTIPVRLPIFPDRLKRLMVSTAPPFNRAMLGRAEAKLRRLIDDGKISSAIAEPLQEILRHDYSAGAVLALPSYSQQSVAVNSLVWKRLFSKASPMPELIFLEIEKIAAMLLESDLSNPKSLANRVMFEPSLREKVLENLDCATGCWDLKKLAKRTSRPHHSRRTALGGCGTVFFWGIDGSGRRIPLYLERGSSNSDIMRGTDDGGKTWELPYTPQDIMRLLGEKRLLPSLFTCFLVVSFARGVTCVGGYFQGQYLPVIKSGIVAALEGAGGFHETAALVNRIPTHHYLDSMLTIMTEIEHGYLAPAGPVEIIAGGGITNADVDKMLSLTVREAHLADMFETVLDAIPGTVPQFRWQKELAKDCYGLLQGKIVVK